MPALPGRTVVLCSLRDDALTAGIGDSSIATYTVFNLEVSLSTFSCLLGACIDSRLVKCRSGGISTTWSPC